jgi:pre-mRNA-processing factor 6
MCREQREREEMEKYRKERPKLQAQFADAKAELSSVSLEEWENLPEVGDVRAKRRKTKDSRPERCGGSGGSALVVSSHHAVCWMACCNAHGTTAPRAIQARPAPYNNAPHRRLTNIAASLIATNVGLAAQATSLDPKGLMTPLSGTETAVADLTQIGKARTGMLNVMLEKASDSVTGQTVIDPKGYLTDLQSMTSVRSATEVGDIQKARLLLKRLTSTNPKHGPGWIAAARLEEVAGKMQAVCHRHRPGCRLNVNVFRSRGFVTYVCM